MTSKIGLYGGHLEISREMKSVDQKKQNNLINSTKYQS